MSNKLKAETLADACAIHYGRLRLRIPGRTAGGGAELRPRRRGSGNERDSAGVPGIGPVGDRVVQPGSSFGFAHGRLAPRPHAARVVPIEGLAAVEKTCPSRRWGQIVETTSHEFCASVFYSLTRRSDPTDC
jgi:hypothetical protein